MIIRDLIDQLLAADAATMNSDVHVCIKGEWKDVEKAILKIDGEGDFVELLIEGNE